MKSILISITLILLVTIAVVAQDTTKAKTDKPAPAERQKQESVTPADKPAAGLAADVQVCTSITDRACTGGATTFDANVGKLYCFSQITGGSADMTIKHIWSHGGKVVAEVTLPVKGSRWRTWSSKTIPASWTGEWEVKVVDASGAELKSVTFTVGK